MTALPAMTASARRTTPTLCPAVAPWPHDEGDTETMRHWMSFAFGGLPLTALLLVADTVAIAALWLLTYELRSVMNTTFERPINEAFQYSKALLVVVPLWLLVIATWGHYIHRERRSSLAQMRTVLGAGKDGLIGSFAIAFLLREYELGRSVVFLSSVGITAWLWTSRAALRLVRQKALSMGVGLRRALVVGTGETARRVMARLAHHPEIGYDLVGCVALDPPVLATIDASEGPAAPAASSSVIAEPVLGTLAELPAILRRERIDEVFLAAPELDDHAMLNTIARCGETPTAFKICSNIMEVITDRVKIDDIHDLPVIAFARGEVSPWYDALKRLMDVAVAGALLVLFAPIILAIAVAIRLTAGAPAFFRQHRVGRGGREFIMLKFRTMSNDTPRYAVAPSDPTDPRITKLGRLLRQTSLDELPQLWNVLRGDMSMVGPRPEMAFLVDKYEDWQRERLKVRPGITGLWQIIGRKNLPLDQHLQYDFFYIKNQSLLLDLLILLRTVPAVIFGRGAY